MPRSGEPHVQDRQLRYRVITEDGLEHVRYPDSAFAEIARVLRKGGVHIFTVPMTFDQPTLERVQAREDGNDLLLAEPEYHGDGLRRRIIAYRSFGYDIFERLRNFGFETRAMMSTLRDHRIGVIQSCVLVSRIERAGAEHTDVQRRSGHSRPQRSVQRARRCNSPPFVDATPSLLRVGRASSRAGATTGNTVAL
jgi:SAM-dependent methyltransferase